jgi:hypothetical protein
MSTDPDRAPHGDGREREPARPEAPTRDRVVMEALVARSKDAIARTEKLLKTVRPVAAKRKE